jgi:murein DD-endopeptidase MepM/ murein hydrolase activator NlpD
MLNLIVANLLIAPTIFAPPTYFCGTVSELQNYKSYSNAQTLTATGLEIDVTRERGIYVPSFIWSVDHSRTGEGFGTPRPETNSIHMGFDIFPGEGTPILASTSGTVIKVEYGIGSYGYMVEIYDGYQYSTLYAHMIAGSFEEYGISLGTEVTQGQVIGLVGNTGRSTAPHLHFEIKSFGVQVDPEPIMAKYAVG